MVPPSSPRLHGPGAVLAGQSLQEGCDPGLERRIVSGLGGAMASTSTGRRAHKRKWVRDVTTNSTHPPPRTFTGSAAEIARTLARKDVSPRGLDGRNLSARRRTELERAKRMLQRRAARQKSTAKGRRVARAGAANRA